MQIEEALSVIAGIFRYRYRDYPKRAFRMVGMERFADLLYQKLKEWHPGSSAA
jgi:hypothetical protein